MTASARLSQPIAVLLSALWIVATANSSSRAATDYDGVWSVSIVAEAGVCPSRTVGIQVADGKVNFSAFGATANGAVRQDGSLKVSFAHHDNVVQVDGALKGRIGYGSWRSVGCGGSWSARKS